MISLPSTCTVCGDLRQKNQVANRRLTTTGVSQCENGVSRSVRRPHLPPRDLPRRRCGPAQSHPPGSVDFSTGKNPQAGHVFQCLAPFKQQTNTLTRGSYQISLLRAWHRPLDLKAPALSQSLTSQDGSTGQALDVNVQGPANLTHLSPPGGSPQQRFKPPALGRTEALNDWLVPPADTFKGWGTCVRPVRHWSTPASAAADSTASCRPQLVDPTDRLRRRQSRSRQFP